MKILSSIVFLFAFFSLPSAPTFAQGKGIDTQTQQIRDIGNSQGPTDNGNRQNVGAGRGIDFGKGKTPERLPLPNPYRMASRRDVLLAAVADLMRERNLILDEAASRPTEGVLISQPYVFAKGAVVTASELERLANLPSNTDEAWTRGRYTLIIEVQTIDGTNNNVSVTAKVEGRSGDALGSNWLTLTSSGEAENSFLTALVERVTGVSPYERPASIQSSTEKNIKPQQQ